jgi:hypothetical protein
MKSTDENNSVKSQIISHLFRNNSKSSTLSDESNIVININDDLDIKQEILEEGTNSIFYIRKQDDNNNKIISENDIYDNFYNMTDVSFHSNFIQSNSPVNSCIDSDSSNDSSNDIENNKSSKNAKIISRIESGYFSNYSSDCDDDIKKITKLEKFTESEKFTLDFDLEKPKKKSFTETLPKTTILYGQGSLKPTANFIGNLLPESKPENFSSVFDGKSDIVKSRLKLDNSRESSSTDIALRAISMDNLSPNRNNQKKVQKYKKLSYKDTENFINKYYNIDSKNKFSDEIEILTTYINGQKIYIFNQNILLNTN